MVEDKHPTSSSEELIVDLTEGFAADLFGAAPSLEALGVAVGRYTVHAQCSPKENQRTYASTGFMLWGSADAFAELLAANPHLIKGKSVLELGCGFVGLLFNFLVAAKKVVATDGDVGTLNLLQNNLNLNKENFATYSISVGRLQWGNQDDIKTVSAASN